MRREERAARERRVHREKEKRDCANERGKTTPRRIFANAVVARLVLLVCGAGDLVVCRAVRRQSMTRERNGCAYLLDGIAVRLEDGAARATELAELTMKRAGVDTRSLHFRLFKRSVDARRRQDIRLVCTVLISADEPLSERVCAKVGLKELANDLPEPPRGTAPMPKPPLVVGMGPAGLFAALALAERGYRPILVDRGDAVAERVKKAERFRNCGVLDTESNVQFGAGGAGTFSDGKLVTRIHDVRCRSVLETLHRFGAPDDVLTLAKPHIGTDVLRTVVERLLAEIERLGGTVRYRCRVTDLREQADGTITAATTDGEISCGAVILAIGHSARDTYETLIEKGYAIEAKPISVGVRIEHKQADIDRALYGNMAGHPELGHAEYALSDTRSARGVYTFCMCPGGEVIAAASEEGGLVTNGMSNRARDGENANAAVLVSVGCADFEPVRGSLARGAIAYQRTVERAAFRVGGGDWFAPMMTVGDFLGGGRGSEPTDILPTYRGGKVRPADFSSVFSEPINESLRYALRSFAKRVSGYDKPSAILTAAETRTSAPIRILRDGELLCAVGHSCVYPCGEGAGYAGGITSAAVDGLRVAEAILARFAVPNGT